MAEEKGKSSFWSWIVIVAFCAAMIVWGVANFLFIKDAPRQFDYGALKDVPAQSPYSSELAPTKSLFVPPQTPGLPEATPKKPLKHEEAPPTPPKETP